MTKYLIVDLANMFYRARHSAHRAATLEEKMAFSVHVTLASIAKCWRDQKADHVVVCLEGRSWRKDYYKRYKANRTEKRAAHSDEEAAEETLFWATFDDFQQFLVNKTNCTVLRHPELEADDLVNGWILIHPDDHHTIVSSDSDFNQCLAENVNQYNGMTDELITVSGIFDKSGKRVLDKKTKEPKAVPDPKWLLFEKCMRGDPGDNVFSAYPGVREKGSKNKVGLREAFADKDSKGFAWNNIMLQRWVDHNGEEHKVLDDYERNRVLVDLTHQPAEIKQKINDTITATLTKSKPMIGAHFLKFCGKYDLAKISESVNRYVEFLQSPYKETQHAN